MIKIIPKFKNGKISIEVKRVKNKKAYLKGLKKAKIIMDDIERAHIFWGGSQAGKTYVLKQQAERLEWRFRLSNLFPHNPNAQNRALLLFQQCATRTVLSSKNWLSLYENLINHKNTYQNVNSDMRLFQILNSAGFWNYDGMKEVIEKGKKDVLNMILIKNFIWPDVIRRSQKIRRRKNS